MKIRSVCKFFTFLVERIEGKQGRSYRGYRVQMGMMFVIIIVVLLFKGKIFKLIIFFGILVGLFILVK